MKSDNINISVRCSILDNKWYNITRFLDYDITSDMDADTASFSFTFDNPNSIFTGLVSGFDRVNIKIGKKGIIQGIVDSVSYTYDDQNSSITVTGRDRVSLLTDNDVDPDSKKNVNPIDYIGGVCGKHGIKYKNKKSIGIVKEFELQPGVSQLGSIAKVLEKSHQKYWMEYDTFYTGSWSTDGKSKHKFTRGVSSKNKGIPIKSLTLNEDYSEARSEVRVYGSNDDGSSKFLGASKLDIVSKRGYIKISTKQNDSDTSNSVAVSTAKTDLNNAFRDSFTIQLTVHNNGEVFMPNTICTVVDRYIGINDTFYIRAVRHYMSVNEGSMSDLTLIPSSSTLEKLKNTGDIMYSLTNTTRTSLKQKISRVLSNYEKKWG